MYSNGPYFSILCWIATLAIACSRPAFAGDTTQALSLDDATIHRTVAKIAAELRAAYVFPEKGQLAAEAIEKSLATKTYDGVADPGELARRITADLQSVTSDPHVRVLHGLPSPSQLAPPPPSDAGFERVDRLKGNIGYIRLSRFVPPQIFADAADRAMRLVANTEALVIDIRGNRGGHPASVAYLTGFFLDPARPVHVNSIVWRNRGTSDFRTEAFWTRATPTCYVDKPVYLLVGPETFSAGEEFAYDLQVLGRATIVGGGTKGGANPGGPAPVGSDMFVVVPSGRAENPVTKGNWEGVGVQPNVRAAPEAALDTAMRLALAGGKSAEGTKAFAHDDWLDAPLLTIRSSPFDG